MPGNEDGYVVKMTDGDPSPPYVVEPGTRIRLVSDYSAAERRLGEHRPPCSDMELVANRSICCHFRVVRVCICLMHDGTCEQRPPL